MVVGSWSCWYGRAAGEQHHWNSSRQLATWSHGGRDERRGALLAAWFAPCPALLMRQQARVQLTTVNSFYNWSSWNGKNTDLGRRSLIRRPQGPGVDHARGSIHVSPSTTATAISPLALPCVRRVTARLVAAVGVLRRASKSLSSRSGAPRAGRCRSQWLAHPSS